MVPGKSWHPGATTHEHFKEEKKTADLSLPFSGCDAVRAALPALTDKHHGIKREGGREKTSHGPVNEHPPPPGHPGSRASFMTAVLFSRHNPHTGQVKPPPPPPPPTKPTPPRGSGVYRDGQSFTQGPRPYRSFMKVGQPGDRGEVFWPEGRGGGGGRRGKGRRRVRPDKLCLRLTRHTAAIRVPVRTLCSPCVEKVAGRAKQGDM